MSGPLGEPPLEALPPDAPATVEDVRASRRWTWVALAWAVAASAVAVLALLQDSNGSTGDRTTVQTTPNVAPQLEKFQQETNDRLDAFSRRLSNAASQDDLQKLDKQAGQIENDVSDQSDAARKQADTITQLQQDLDHLKQRVDDLEAQAQQQQQDQTATP